MPVKKGFAGIIHKGATARITFAAMQWMKQIFAVLADRRHAAHAYAWLTLGLAIVVAAGMRIDVMDVDAAQYASIALEMTQNGSWLQVIHRGADYLDKPPLLFWLSAWSFKLFGAANWSYKLPSVLGALAGVWATYRFARLYYHPKTARQAAFILAASVGLIVICNDVRTDTLLLGMSACAIWQLSAYLDRGGWPYLIGGFFFAGLAMLAKGPIGLVMPGLAVGTHLLLSGRWRDIFRWQWLLGLVVTGLVLAPMCYGLWQQFDLHPEKTVDGRQGVSGLYFFFWEQSFGRITGENKWRNDTSVFYFLHVYLWAFLPWCLLLPGAWYRRLRDILGRREAQEYYSFGAFTLTFIALSLSKYKLPHYIFVTLPWASILVASWLNPPRETAKPGVWSWAALYTAAAAGLAIAFLAMYYVFPSADARIWGLFLAALGFFGLMVYNRTAPADSDALVQRGVWVSLIIGGVLNGYFYPQLLPYQSSKAVATAARAQGIPPDKLAYFHRGSHALDFYNGRCLEQFEQHEAIRQRAKAQGPIWIHADEAGKGELEINQVPFEIVQTFSHFPVTLLRPAFLDPARRDATLDRIYLLKILPD